MATSKAYEIAFKLGAKLDKTYGKTFDMAESIANKTVGNLVKVAASIGGAVLSVDAIKSSVEKAVSFESAMADVAKTVDGLKDSSGRTTEAYAVMAKSILDMTAYLPMTGEELAKITAAAGQAGIALNDLTAFTETAAKMGVAFDVTAEQAGEWMAGWRTAFKMSQSEVTTLADQINYLSNTSSENATKLSDVVNRIGSFGEIAGISAGEVAAMAASMTGVTAENAATGIKNLMKALGQGSSASKSQLAVLSKLGLSSKQIAKGIQSDAQGTILKVLSAFKKIDESERSAAIMDYFGDTSIAAIAPLLNNLENLQEQFTKVGDASLYAGSMEKEFASRAATTENKIKLAQNAIERLQISLGNLMLPLVAKGANFAADFSTENMDEIVSAAENAWKKVEPVFKWVQTHPETIVKFLASIGAAITASKLASGLKGVAGGFSMITKGIQGLGTMSKLSSLLTLITGLSPAILILAGVAAGVTALGVSIALTNAKMKKENLAAHFGDISLSLNEIDNVAKRIVRTNNFEKISESLNAFNDMDAIQDSVTNAVKQLDKLNWKVSIGLDLSENDKQSYIQNVDSFISESQNLLDQKQYAINLSLNAMSLDSETNQVFLSKVNDFYNNSRTELARLGTDLQNAVNDAFEDGLLIPDEQKVITDIQKQMAAITEAIAKSQFDAKMEVMGMEFSGAKLTGEMYDKLQDQINEELTTVVTEHKEALIYRISEANLLYDSGGKDRALYDDMVNAAKDDYFSKVSEAEIIASRFQTNTMMQSYGEEVSAIIPELATLLSKEAENIISLVNETGMTPDMGLIAQSIWETTSNLDKYSKANISDQFEKMKPTLDQKLALRNECIEMGKQIPEGLNEAILDMSAIGALVGDANSIFTILGASFANSEEFHAMQSILEEQGGTLPDSLISAVGMRYSDAESIGEGLANSLLKGVQSKLSKGIIANIPINATSSGFIGPLENTNKQVNGKTVLNVPQFAIGSDYTPDTFIAGEKGAELITSRAGSKVFTAFETNTIIDNITTVNRLISDGGSGFLLNRANMFNSDTSSENIIDNRIFNRYEYLFADGESESSDYPSFLTMMETMSENNYNYGDSYQNETPVTIKITASPNYNIYSNNIDELREELEQSNADMESWLLEAIPRLMKQYLSEDQSRKERKSLG